MLLSFASVIMYVLHYLFTALASNIIVVYLFIFNQHSIFALSDETLLFE